MPLRYFLLAGLCVAGLCAISLPGHASTGNVATNYGLLPIDVGSAQGLSLFNTQVSSAFFNPAQLSSDVRGELNGALLHAAHELKAISLGGSNPPIREGDVLFDRPTQQSLLGLKTNLSSLTTLEKPIHFGFMLGVEKFGAEMLAFSSETSREGQFMRFGRQPLFLNMGVAAELVSGFDIGIAATVTLASEATFITRANLAGDTEFEQLRVNAEPTVRGIYAGRFELGELFCRDDCALDRWQTALVFRANNSTSTDITSITVVPGTIPSPGLVLLVDTLSSWHPDTLAGGVQYQGDSWRMALTLERQKWRDLEDKLRGDVIKDQADLRFDNTLVPRIGLEKQLARHYWLRAGIAWEESPLQGRESLNVNYFDNDRLIIGIGSAVQIPKPPILAHPVQLEFGYQYQNLRSRSFDMTASDAPGNPFETVKAKGDVHVFTGSMMLKF